MTDNEIINRQKAEIDILIRKKEALQDKVAEQQAEIEKLNTSFDVVKQEYADMFSANRNLMAEIERLKPKCEDCAGCNQWKCDCSNIRNFSIQEFAERLKEKCAFERGFAVMCDDVIDNLVAEMTEQRKAVLNNERDFV